MEGREGGMARGRGVNSAGGEQCRALATLTMAIKSANDNGGNTVASNDGRKCCHYSATLIESNTRSDNSNTNNNKGDKYESNSRVCETAIYPIH